MIADPAIPGKTAYPAPIGAYERFAESQPILNMLSLLARSGRKNFNEHGIWEICFCALVLRLEPNCKVQHLLEALPASPLPMDDADFLNTMAHLGYYCRPASAAVENIDERLLPGVFIPGKGDPCIVLGRGSNGSLQFYDPVSRLVSNVPPSFDKAGKVWFFQRYDKNRAATSAFMRKGSGHNWFRAMLGRFDDNFTEIMVAGLVLNIIALFTPIFIMLVYDRVLAAGAPGTLPMLAFGAAASIAFEWRLRHIRSTGLSWLAGRMDNIVGNEIFSHLIGLSPALIEKASVSAQIARIKTFESVRDFFSGSVFLSVLEAPFVFIAVIAIAFIAGPLVFVPLFMALGYLALFLFMRRKIKVSIRLAAKASSARQQFTIETFEKLDGIRSHGLSLKWQDKFRHLSGREIMEHFQLGWIGIVTETLAHALTIISAVVTVAFGVHLIWAGAISTGALVATMILVWRILTPFYSLCTIIPRLEQLRSSIMQVNDLMDISTEAEEAQSYSRLPKLSGAVSFHNVSFRYSENGDDIFSGLSFDARPGELIAITGNSGAGKATVLKLIKALYRPSGGAVRIDGFDIRQLDAPDLRRQIAYVPKTPCFFKGSVMDNMWMSNPLASEDDIRRALDQTDALNDVHKLPDGAETIISMHGAAILTPGLAAKLSLARAYLHPGALVLIDELPNSLLAGRAGENFKTYLRSCKGRRTVIFCTYREDYIELADKVVHLRGFQPPMVRMKNATSTGTHTRSMA